MSAPLGTTVHWAQPRPPSRRVAPSLYIARRFAPHHTTLRVLGSAESQSRLSHVDFGEVVVNFAAVNDYDVCLAVTGHAVPHSGGHGLLLDTRGT